MIDETRFEALERLIQRLADRQAILDCIVREARGRDRQDIEMTLSAFWDDALDEHGPKVSLALEYPEKANAGHSAFFKATNHNLANHTCEIEGDVAHCETYVVGSMLLKNLKSTILLIGRYIDRFERRNGEWRIALRRTIVDTSLLGESSFLQTPMVAGFPKGLWTKQDPSYQRPIDLEVPVDRW
ncbi:MAG: nuclear transport factor 2 family protein [Novosphingobium sp.]